MPNYIICSSTSRNYEMVSFFNKSGIGNFYLITTPKQLTIDFLSFIKPEYIFFPHWSYIINAEIYDNFNCIIFHMTDLPYGRGGSPLQNLIIRGKRKTKMSALKCTNVLDGGDLYLKEALDLSGSAEEILLRAKDLMMVMITKIIEENPLPSKQAGAAVTFKRRTPDQSEIENASDLTEFYDYIRMLDAEGYPNAFIEK
ncbi:MAG: methionyl-tRNA formyltransferase, partial [Rickettsiales bacterium]|nr:methionyl-tRNA formyltransferase [Rickettsiales bacterium]